MVSTHRKVILRAGTELKFENYESVQHGLQFSGKKKGAKISFHRHFKFVLLILYLLYFWFLVNRSIKTNFEEILDC